ncbi:MAG TPA: TonB-dependent receptor [Bacteroides sp.]|nr:TonB-dependent receptor [Bacteroides sp.]
MKYLAIIAFLVLAGNIRSQDMVLIKGRIADSLSGDPLIGANIVTAGKKGTISDPSGNYNISVPDDPIVLTFQYLGYISKTRTVKPEGPDTVILNILLSRSTTPLDEIVISAGRYEQRLSEVMVSLDIIKLERIANTSTTSLETILRQSSGVEILDGQPSIRGGVDIATGREAGFLSFWMTCRSCRVTWVM